MLSFLTELTQAYPNNVVKTCDEVIGKWVLCFDCTGGEDCSGPSQLGGTPQCGPSAGGKGDRSKHPGPGRS